MKRYFKIGLLSGVIFSILILFLLIMLNDVKTNCATAYIENARYGACQRFVSENCNVSPESIKLTQDEINKMKLKGYYAENLQELIDKYYFGINITAVKKICGCPGY